MSGHLFIIDGDLTKVACDALLIPTDGSFDITPHWLPYLVTTGHGEQIFDLQEDPWTGWSGSNMVALTRREKEPQIWLGNIGEYGQTSSFDVFAPKIEEFVLTSVEAHRDPENVQRIHQWDKPRVALPVVGADQGGGSECKGDLILGLVKLLAELSSRPALDADIVLVTHGQKAYAAAQRARRMLVRGEEVWSHWTFSDEPPHEDLVKRARDLARAAIESHLVLFLGAGVSAGAGLPNWTELLADVAEDVNFEPREALAHLDPRDQATILQRRLEVQLRSLADAVAQHLSDAPYYSLAAGLLASLPSHEAVTTNFDTLFERAWSTAGRETAILPEEVAAPNGRWLLKLHGSIEKPEDIVLTRSDYLDMPRHRGALMGLVQGLLMMRHMMFVGYSMRDEDFHELIYEVRNAMGPGQKDTQIGTVLTLQTDPLTNELWTNDLCVVAVTDGSTEISGAARSRQLEIFLDLVGYFATTSSAFFLDRTYDAVSSDEPALRAELSRLFWNLRNGRSDDRDDLVSNKVLRFLEDELGAGPEWTRRIDL